MYVSIDGVRQELRKRAGAQWGDAGRLAKECGVSTPLLSQIISGKRGDRSLNRKLLKALGYETTPFYRKKV